MTIKAMKQALEALNKCQDWPGAYEECEAAITALRTAIEQGQLEMAPAFRSSHAYSVGFRDGQAAQQQAQEPVAWVYPEGLEALKSGRPWTAYGSNGYSRIPLYLNNDAVARRIETRESGSGAGFESLPASPTWWDEPVPQMNYRKWQGLTDEEIENMMDYWSDDARSAYGGAHAANGEYVSIPDIIRDAEAKLKEKNHG